MLDEAALEIVDLGLSLARPSDEAHLKVANFVEDLNAHAIEAVVLVTGELPRGVLGALKSEIIEEMSKGMGNLLNLDIRGSVASFILSECECGLGFSIGDLSSGGHLVSIIT